MYLLLKPCKTSAAIEAVPRERLSLDLDRCEEVLGKECAIVANAGIMLIVSDLCEVSIHKDGRLILKTDSQELAADQAGRIAGWLGGTEEVRKQRDGRRPAKHSG